MGFTDEQQRVIDSRNKNLIVSAAAGSGKTAVLSERIAEKICNEENPSSIDRMLIVTFTNAAAREMRDRIGKRLRQKLAENPDNSHIRRQIAILHTALITTIDSFCLYILKNHFEEIGIDPSFTVGTQGELSQISSDAFDEAIDEAFREGKESFKDLVEMFAPSGKFKGFKDLVLWLANRVDSTPYPYDTLANLIVREEEDIWGSSYIKFIEKYENDFFLEARDYYARVEDIVREGELTKHRQKAREEKEFMEQLAASPFRERIRLFSTHTKTSLSYGGKRTFSPEDTERKALAKECFDYADEIVKGIKETFHYANEETFERLVKDGHYVTNSLIDFTCLYMRIFEAMKREKGLISFSDMEHLALEILIKKEDGKLLPSPTALRYRDYFEEVMIDEYQDSNDVQEAVLSVISKDEKDKGNRFMVGDIKQSIYGFRLAKPEIFKEKCVEYSKEENANCERINLTKNFRSRKEVIDAVNHIFEHCMKKEVGGVEYDENERLFVGNTDYPESASDNTAEFLYFNKEEFADDEDFNELKDFEIEARMVAKRINELMEAGTEVFDKKKGSMRPLEYSDIAILLRGMDGGKDVAFQKACKDAGIPAYVISKAGYYSAWEIQLILNFLLIIDNPRQDMPLLGVMHSFIGGFSEDEIAKIRLHGRRKRLIDSLYLYILEGKDDTLKEKVNKFTDELDDLRKKALYFSASDLLRFLYDKYEYPVMVSSLPNGEQRLANVNLLVDTADEYESQGIYCIHDFVKYVEKLKTREIDMGEANMLDENANVVQIMTIHKSKGLEYPVCFVSGMHTEFKKIKDKMLFDEEFGIGGDAFDLGNRVKMKSPLKNAIKAKAKINNLGEEIRVLYVALTRAREKLIMTCRLKEEDFESKEDLSFVDIMKAKSFSGLVYPLIIGKPDLFSIKKYSLEDLRTEGVIKETERISKIDLLKEIGVKEEFEEYRYPHDSLEGLFVKTTVSELKKAAYLEREDGENTLYHAPEKRIPKFIKNDSENIGGSRRGSAYHRVMELMDFEHIYDGDLEKNLQEHRLTSVTNLFISEEDDKLVSEKKIIGFLNTDLSKRMSNAAKNKKLYLEQPFVLSVNAKEVREEFPDSEKILVQGVIDVYFEEDGKLILMDYKTDRVDSGEELIKRYKTQLDYYAEALSRLEKKPVAEILIYSFSLGEVIRIK